ncbi:alpha-galactosidase [Gorillibacterium timonense]|uniref:alpha-galactosidase n=1 Tax=Gorillibacterium timonense TaxID=1689269 RepID=UPI00071C6C35|nr:alpha-galactosidase [Gorillibacterium timonense]
MSIQYLSNERIWIIETARTSYAMAKAENNMLVHLYWGERLPFASDYSCPPVLEVNSQESVLDILNPEYPGWGGIFYAEPCLKATFSDGVRDVVLEVAGHSIQEGRLPELCIELKDVHYGLSVDLHYRVVEELDLIERWAVVRNTGDSAITIESAQSAQWSVPGNHSYRFTHLAGKYFQEMQLRQTSLTEGKKTIESRRSNTSNHNNPWFALDRGNATEAAGNVWFGALAWSGSWKITAEVTPFYEVRVTGGMNDFDFGFKLAPGEQLETPPFIGGFTTEGFGGGSRHLHRYQLDHILPREHAGSLRKVLYNSWEATFFDVNENDQGRIAEKAAAMGVELFVVDDGWFGQRKNDASGLGDWYVNPVKFPNGLKPLIDHVHALGMDFGIWVEPEMVNPDSDLYREHPDWVIHFPNRARSEARNQLMLNLARRDVREYIFDFMNRLLGDHEIEFIKWDMNRPISEPGWPELPIDRQREIWVEYVRGLYEIVDRLKAAHPTVIFESCSSGGGRVDMGILKRTDQTWPSDNTNALERLKIQEGYAHGYAPKTMMAWVTDNADSWLPLSYRFHCAMMGSLGIGGNLHHWSEEKLAEASRHIAEYKTIRHLIQEGLQYRLLSPREGNLTAVQYVSPDQNEAVLFVFSVHQSNADPIPPVYLQGLQPDQLYKLDGYDRPMSGRSLMSQGLPVAFQGVFQSRLIKIAKA